MQPDRQTATQADKSIPVGEDNACSTPTVVHIERCIRHLIFQDMEKSSGNGVVPPKAKRLLLAPEQEGIEPQSVVIGDEGVGLDSLAMISAASAVSQYFDLGSSGVDDYLMFETTIGGWASLVAQHFERQSSSARIVFETSGSTDAPTRVCKCFVALSEEVDALLTSVIPEGVRRIVALTPPQHIYGMIFTVLLPSWLNVRVVDGTNKGVGSLVAGLEYGDLVIGTPFNWKMLVSHSESFPTGVHGVTSGGPMPMTVWKSIAASGLKSLTEVFGSTETGGIAWRTEYDHPFTLLPHLVRDGEAVATRTTAEALPLQDHLNWVEGRCFQPAGRIDRAVQIAGVNVSLEKVRAALEGSPQISEVAVRRDGERLKAFVVPVESDWAEDALVDHLHARARDALDPVARPAAYTIGPQLPRNAMGKLTDW